MNDGLIISLDGMGGDGAPASVVKGAALASVKLPEASFLLFGDEAKLAPLVAAEHNLRGRVDIKHTDMVIGSSDKPSIALRRGRKSSMRLAIDAVRDGHANCVVSSGNTGALMAMAMFSLRTIEGIDRPAISSIFPSINGVTCMLDLGANVDCDADNLVQFAIMGEVFVRTVLDKQRPSVGLLNVGVEDLKGRDEVKQAAAKLKQLNINIDFKGFVEGDDIGKGSVDVIVTDGYTGNVALKTIEGTSKLITYFLKDAFNTNLFTKICYLFAINPLNILRKRVDPRLYNGAVFLGLNGIAVKSHGGTDGFGFSNAIAVAANMAKNDFINKMRDDIESLNMDGSDNNIDKSEDC